MLRKLKLYGELAEFVGHKEFEIQVDSLAKAVSFLVNNFPQVEKLYESSILSSKTLVIML